MKYIIVSFFLVVSSFGRAEEIENLQCAYSLMSVPFARVAVGIWPNGQPQSSAEVQMGVGGQMQKMSVTPAPLNEGEAMHVWLSKEAPNSAIEMIVYSEWQSQGDSKLINHKAPIGKEMWGDCEFK